MTAGNRTSSAGASWMSHEKTSLMTSVPAWSRDAARPRCATVRAQNTSGKGWRYNKLCACSLAAAATKDAKQATVCNMGQAGVGLPPADPRDRRHTQCSHAA